MSFDWKIMKSKLKMICWSLDFVFKAGNVSRTQELLKKKNTQKYFFLLPVLYFSKYTIFKLPKGNICQISRKTSALKIQSNSEYCFMKRDLKCGWRSFCKRAERNTCLLQPTCNVSLSRIFFVNAREQLQCRKHVVI